MPRQITLAVNAARPTIVETISTSKALGVESSITKTWGLGRPAPRAMDLDDVVQLRVLVGVRGLGARDGEDGGLPEEQAVGHHQQRDEPDRGSAHAVAGPAAGNPPG
jgi:hypothetical protein